MMERTAPDTVPSLGEVSRASSDHGDVSRVLFKTPKKGNFNGQNTNDDDTMEYSAFDHTTLGYTSAEGESTYDCDDTWDGDTETLDSRYFYSNGDDPSTFVSAFTAQTGDTMGNEETASKDTSHEGETLETYSVYDDSTAPSKPDVFMWPSNDIKKYFRRLSQTSKETDDDNVNHSCHEAFVTAPKDVLKHLFDFRGTPTAPSLTPTSIATTQVTEVTRNTDKESLTWTRQIESLQRECKTLKEIIDGDSKNILRLKAEIQKYRENGGSKDYGTIVLEKEIKDLREREQSLLNTVETLQMNLSNGNAMDLDIPQNEEIQRLQFQCQMFSYQIVELEKENHELSTQNETLRHDMSLIASSTSSTTIHEITPTKLIQHRPIDSLRAQVSSLVDKFSQIEEDMDRREKARDEQSRTLQALESLEDTSTIAFVYSSSDISTPDKGVNTSDSAIVEQDGDLLTAGCSQEEDVEVTLDGLIIATSRSEDPHQVGQGPGLSSTVAASRSAFCGCLNPSSD